MNHRKSSVALIASVVAWAALCVVSYISSSTLAFEFSYFVLPFSSMAIPAVIASLAMRAYENWASNTDVAPNRSSGSIASYMLASVAYLLSWLGLARLPEIPWRKAKFGESLDLGTAGVAMFFAVTILFIGASLLSLRAAPRNSRRAKAAIASVGMLTFVAGLFALVASTPLVQWRQ